MSTSTLSALRILRLHQLRDRTGLSRSTIYDRMNPKSPRFDDAFPRPIKLGPSAIGWIEAEVEQWLQQRIHARSLFTDWKASL